MKRTHIQRIVFLFVVLPAVMIAIPLVMTWRAVRQQQLNREPIATHPVQFQPRITPIEQQQLNRELTKAVTMNDTPRAVRLLNAGATPNITDGIDKTIPISETQLNLIDVLSRSHSDRAAGVPLLIIATANRNEPLVKAMLDRGAQVEAVSTNPDLHYSQVMSSGDTALKVASEHDSTEIVRLLLSRHANANAHDVNGVTPLMCTNDAAIAQMLIDHGADVNARTTLPEGRTVLSFSLQNDMIVQLLLSHGADINEKSGDGTTVLMEAALHGDVQKVDALLDHRADVNARAGNGCTALMFASAREQWETIHELLRRGADPNIVDHDGDTALIIALTYDEYAADPVDAIRTLIYAGAKLNIRDRAGRTALGIAISRGQSKCVRLLKTAGAKK